MGLLRAEPAGGVLAGEAAAVREIERRSAEDGDAGVGGDFVGQGERGVAGVVVDDEDLPLLAQREAGFGLGDEGGKAGRERAGLVAGRDDNGELEGCG